MQRVQKIVLPLLRAALPGVTVTSQIPDVDQRSYPLVNARRVGGSSRVMDLLDRPTIELIVISDESRTHSEELFMDARQVIWDAVAQQTVTDAGYLHSFRETVGPTPTSSPFPDTFMTQGLIQLGVRPPRLEI